MTGQASVIGGDTTEVHGTRIRLQGIDAAESGQVCYIGGKQWRCGKEAACVLADQIDRRPPGVAALAPRRGAAGSGRVEYLH